MGLVDAARNQKDDKVIDYLWIVCQLKCGENTLAKLLKIAD